FARPPAIVFVTAHDDRAVDAFDLGAVDYLLKPVRPDRLAETLRQVLAARAAAPAAPRPPAPRQQPADEVIPVELAGRTRMVRRCAGWRRRGTTRGCTPRTARTWCGWRWRCWRSAGPTRGSSASTARTWWRCA